MNFDLYYAANKADEEFHQALVKVYGKDACNARYDRKRNRATPELAEAYTALDNAMYAWGQEMYQHRQNEGVGGL